MADRVQIVIDRFWTVYKPDPKDGSKMVGIDMMAYGPLTQLDRSKRECTVSSMRPSEHGQDSGNPSVGAAVEKWARIEPAYLAWKRGQEIPEDGTPLAAWNGITPEQAQLLRVRGIRTVESVALMGDGMVERLGMPGTRDLIRSAQAWLEAKDQNQFAQKLLDEQRERENQNVIIAEQAERLAEQDQRLNDMQKMMAEMMSRQFAPEEPPPPKQQRRRQEEVGA